MRTDGIYAFDAATREGMKARRHTSLGKQLRAFVGYQPRPSHNPAAHAAAAEFTRRYDAGERNIIGEVAAKHGVTKSALAGARYRQAQKRTPPAL